MVLIVYFTCPLKHVVCRELLVLLNILKVWNSDLIKLYKCQTKHFKWQIQLSKAFSLAVFSRNDIGTLSKLLKCQVTTSWRLNTRAVSPTSKWAETLISKNKIICCVICTGWPCFPLGPRIKITLIVIIIETAYTTKS